ncbi:hydroxymethylbilane synthase [Phycisphaeraceae bacterium D3-23]
MRRSQKPIVIASRRSPLARVQAEMVARGLSRLHPQLEVQFVWIESEGDQVTTGPLSAVGGKGLFTKAVERAVLSGKADLAVHSMKDMPADEETPGLQIAAVPKRTDVRDVLVARSGAQSLTSLPHGATLGTSSPRRAAQLLRARPDLVIELLRGNVGTRVQRTTQGPGPDATLLAAAGLRRLAMTRWLGGALDVATMLPPAGQGALGIQCRRDDHISLTRCLPLNDATTSTAVHAERGLVAALGADCHSPIAVLAEQVDPAKTQAKRNSDSHRFRLRARVLASDGSRLLEVDDTCKTRDLRRLVASAVKDLSDRGAAELLEDCRGLPLGRASASKAS